MRCIPDLNRLDEIDNDADGEFVAVERDEG